VGLPRYLAASRIDDPERTAFLVAELIAAADNGGAVCLLQIGRSSPLAHLMSQQLHKLGQRTKSVIVRDREAAQSDATLNAAALASAVWVFADDLLETFLTLFATPTAFALRSKSRAGLPVVGIGGGAVSLGGLLLASRICAHSQYDLVGGLGWAPRALLDSSAVGYGNDPTIARTTVRSLPSLLAMELGAAGAVRVQGGRIESVGSEPVILIGDGGDGSLLALPLEPGMARTIAPPPFKPFERQMLPAETLRALHADQAKRPPSLLPVVPPPLRQAPTPEALAEEPGSAEEQEEHSSLGSGRMCPMCKQVHTAEARVELAA
jgi:hypothetical protein